MSKLDAVRVVVADDHQIWRSGLRADLGEAFHVVGEAADADEALQELGAEDRLWEKVPTADLLDGTPGQTDEAELGLRYEDIDDYLEGREIDQAAAEKLERLEACRSSSCVCG